MSWAEPLRRALAALPQRRMPRAPLGAAVLAPVYEAQGRLHLVLTRRLETLRSHPGQVAFPGGRIDPGEGPLEGALREADEELGIPPARVEPLGTLGDVVVRQEIRMRPFVGRIPAGLELRPNPEEVAHAFSVPLEELVDPKQTRFGYRTHEFLGKSYRVPYFEWEAELIWGATGYVVLELLRVLELEPRPTERAPRPFVPPQPRA